MAGTPVTVAATANWRTGQFLAPHLKAHKVNRAAHAPRAEKRVKAATKHIASADKHHPLPRKKCS